MIGDVPQKFPKKAGGISMDAICEGIHFILNRPIILSTMLLDFVATFFASANTMLPIMARDILNVGNTGFVWLTSAEAVGAVSAALVISQFPKIAQAGNVIFGSVIVFGLRRSFLA